MLNAREQELSHQIAIKQARQAKERAQTIVMTLEQGLTWSATLAGQSCEALCSSWSVDCKVTDVARRGPDCHQHCGYVPFLHVPGADIESIVHSFHRALCTRTNDPFALDEGFCNAVF
jgi:hypothetical protein